MSDKRKASRILCLDTASSSAFQPVVLLSVADRDAAHSALIRGYEEARRQEARQGVRHAFWREPEHPELIPSDGLPYVMHVAMCPPCRYLQPDAFGDAMLAATSE